MEYVEDAMQRQGNCNQPERMLETDESQGQKHCGHGRLDNECVGRPAYHSEQDVI